MALKLNRALGKVAKSFAIPQKEHELFLSRVDTIKTKLFEKLDEINSVFKDMITNLEETAYYMKGFSSVDLPLEFNAYLKLMMPFKIEPDFDSPTLNPVQLRTNVNHPIVADGIIKPILLNFLIDGELKKATTTMGLITCKDGAVFKLCYEQDFDESGCIITASEITEGDVDGNKIIFSFMPAIMVIKDDAKPLPSWIWVNKNQKYWLALPYTTDSERNYYAINHKWQSAKKNDKIKAKNLIILLQKFLTQIFKVDLVDKLKAFILTFLDQEDRENLFSEPLSSLFMEVLTLFGVLSGREFFDDSPDGLLNALIINVHINGIHLKFEEFQSGQKKFTADDIKALFSV